MGFAFGRPAPKKKEIEAASVHVRNGKGIETSDVQTALTAGGSKLWLKPRPDLRFFDKLATQRVGMFVGGGDIWDRGQKQPHFFSYDAGRKVMYDRGGEITLLDAKDLTREGSGALFYSRFAVPGQPNLGCAVLREVHQVMLAGEHGALSVV